MNLFINLGSEWPAPIRLIIAMGAIAFLGGTIVAVESAAGFIHLSLKTRKRNAELAGRSELIPASPTESSPLVRTNYLLGFGFDVLSVVLIMTGFAFIASLSE